MGLLLLLPTACASVPWPPPAGSCLEAHTAPFGTRRETYRVHGRPLNDVEVARTLAGTSADVDRLLRRKRTLDILTPTVVISGAVLFLGGGWTGIALRRPAVAMAGLPGYAMIALIFPLTLASEQTFRQAVVRFNAHAAEEGTCRSWDELSAPRATTPPPGRPDGLPDLSGGGWIP